MNTNQESTKALQDILRELPLFQSIEERSVKEAFACADSPDTANVSPVLKIAFAKAPLIPSEKIDPEGHKEARRKDTPAQESVIVEELSGDSCRHIAPYGNLLNLAFSLLSEKLDEEDPGPWLAGTIEDYLQYAEIQGRIEKVEKTQKWVDALLEEGTKRGADKITANRTLMFFLALLAQPKNLPSASSASCKVCSLMDILFYSFYYAEEIFKTAPVLKRCKMCKRLFFACPSNREYCYFEVKDEILSGMSCFIAKDTRKTREASYQKEIDKVLRRIRANTSDAEGYATEARLKFTDAYDVKKQELENDPWQKLHLLEWVKEQEKGMKKKGVGGERNG